MPYPLTMGVTIRREGEYLVATVASGVDDQALVDIRNVLVERVARDRPAGVILDLSSVDVVDSFAAHTLRHTADLLRLRGAATMLIGLQPDVAFSMGRHGLTFEGIPLARDLASALECLDRRRQRSTSRAN